MRGNYQKPSDLLKQQKESGLSYWDLVGRPLYGNPTQEDPAQQAVLNRQIDAALDGFIPNVEYPKYKKGKNKPVSKSVNPQTSRPNYTIGQFVDIMSPIVWNEIKRQGIKNPERVHNYMMRQLGWESWYGNTSVAKKNHNYGGVGHYIKDGEHRYTNYANDEAFVRGYVDLLKRKYGKAIAAPTLRQYSKELKRGGYYEDDEAHYTSNLMNMKSLDRELARHRKANPKIYNGAKFTPVVLGQTESPVENPVIQYTQPEVVPAPTYAQQPTMQVSPAVQAPTIDPQYEQYMAEKQARQDAFNLAMNNVYSKLPNPVDRLGQFMQFNRGKSLNPVIYY